MIKKDLNVTNNRTTHLTVARETINGTIQKGDPRFEGSTNRDKK